MNLKFNNRNLLLFLLLLLNCTITIKPKINVNVIDTTDSLEKQILGEFKIVENKMLYYENIQGNNKKPLSSDEKKFYTAMKNRIFFQDKILDFLQKKYVGEGDNGKLIILFDDKNNIIYNDILEMVSIENDARNTIINYVAKKENISNTEEFWKTFHKLQVENLKKGMLYQEGGIWKEKK